MPWPICPSPGRLLGWGVGHLWWGISEGTEGMWQVLRRGCTHRGLKLRTSCLRNHAPVVAEGEGSGQWLEGGPQVCPGGLMQMESRGSPGSGSQVSVLHTPTPEA